MLESLRPSSSIDDDDDDDDDDGDGDDDDVSSLIDNGNKVSILICIIAGIAGVASVLLFTPNLANSEYGDKG